MEKDKNFKFINIGKSAELDIAGDEARFLLGYLCNSNCKFCVQGHRPRFNRTFEEIKKDMIKARKRGATDSAFCGGEPTIRKDFFDILFTIKKLGFKTMMMATNGRMFAYKEFAKKFVDHLLPPNEKNGSANSIVFSIHGHKPEIHDFLTGVHGAFEQVCKGLKNLKEVLKKEKKENWIRIYCNQVIMKQNYRYMPKFVDFISKFHLFDLVQFIFILPYENAQDNYNLLVPKMTDVIPFLSKTIEAGKKADIKIRFQEIPFCLMRGYEEHVSELYDKVSDFDEYLAANGRIKLKKCKECRFDKICFGFNKDHIKNIDENKIIPIKGKKIETKEEFYKELESQGRELVR